MVQQKRLRDYEPDERSKKKQMSEIFHASLTTASQSKRGILNTVAYGNTATRLVPDFHQLQAAFRLRFRDKDKRIDERNGSLLLMHEVGTGKTITAILAMAAVWGIKERHKDSKILIVVPKSVLEIWAETIRKWTTWTGNSLLVADKQDKITEHDLARAFAVLTTPDAVVEAFKSFCYQDNSEKMKGVDKMKRWKCGIDPNSTSAKDKQRLEIWGDGKPPVHPLFEHMRKQMGAKPFLLTIIDEIHDQYKPTTIRGLVLHQFAQRSTYKLGLTGTPVSAKPDEFQYIAYTLDAQPIKLQQRKQYFKDAPQQGQQQPLSKEGIDEFHRLLVDRVDASFLDLPERKRISVEYNPFVGLNPEDGTTDASIIEAHNEKLEAAQRAAKQLSAELRQTKEHDITKWGASQQAAFSAISSMGQFEFYGPLGVLGAEKFKQSEAAHQSPNLYEQAAAAPSQAMKLIVRLIQSRQAACHSRIAVFCPEETQLKILQAYLISLRGKGTDVGQLFLFQSKLSAQKREKMRTDFLGCLKGVILLTEAGAVGITLCPGCEVMLFIGSLPWNATTIEQAGGRIYRRGQTEKVETIQLVARNSVTAVKLLLHEDKRERLAKALADRDWSKFSEGDTKWRKTERIIGQCHMLNNKGNYEDPRAREKLMAYQEELRRYRALKEQADANGVPPPAPPARPPDLDFGMLQIDGRPPPPPSMMPLPPVSFPNC